MASAFNKFNSFVEACAEKVHNLGSDQLMVALTNAANPPLATDTVLADQVEIAYTNCSSRVLTQASSAQSGGTYKLVLNDLVLTATGGSVGPFRYVILYNNTATNKELIGWYDYLSDTTLLANETMTLDFDPGTGVLTIA
ncbi:MAG: hypothetical protein AAGU17_11060 [Anaerolineaceae bacterium]